MKLNEFEYRLLKFIKKEGLIDPGERIVLAVSGGADSVAMMYALNSIKMELKAEFIVAHLNHMIRPEASKEGPAVCKMAKALKMKCLVEMRNVPEYKKEHNGLSLEEAARIVRYQFLEDTMRKFNATKIATAHHLSDLTENFFIRLFRGSGIGGLIGMRPKNGSYIKPFLIFDEKTIREYVTIKKVSFFEDKTNLDVRYVRNKVRHILVPMIKNEFCSKIENKVLEVTEVLREYQDFVNDKVEEIFEKAVVSDDGKISFSTEDLDGKAHLLLSELVKECFRRLKIRISREKIDSVVDLIEKAGEGEINLGKNKYAVKTRDTFFVGPKIQSLKWKEPIELRIPGGVEIKELSLKVNAKIENFNGFLGDAKTVAVVDAEKVEFPLFVRTPKSGEKVIPLGMNGHKSVLSILKDRKVSVHSRKIFPIISQKNGKIVWIVGITIPEDFKVTKTTRKVLLLIREGGNF